MNWQTIPPTAKVTRFIEDDKQDARNLLHTNQEHIPELPLC